MLVCHRFIICDVPSTGGYYLVTGGTDHVIRIYKMYPTPIMEPWELTGHTVSHVHKLLAHPYHNIMGIFVGLHCGQLHNISCALASYPKFAPFMVQCLVSLVSNFCIYNYTQAELCVLQVIKWICIYLYLTPVLLLSEQS